MWNCNHQARGAVVEGCFQFNDHNDDDPDDLSNQNKPSTSILTLFQTKNWVRSMHFINKLLPWNIKCSIITLSKRINLLLATNFGGYCYRSKPHNVYFSRHIFSTFKNKNESFLIEQDFKKVTSQFSILSIELLTVFMTFQTNAIPFDYKKVDN